MSDDRVPVISVVTVCLNAEAFIGEALDSVAAQDYEDYELVVMDGGSTDGTVEIIRGCEAEFSGRLRWCSEPDEGLYDAMNKGLRAARGRYIAYLGADDRLAPGALALVDMVVREHEGPDLVAGAVRVFGGASEWVEKPRSFADRRLPKRAPARHQSLFVCRDLIERVGGFDGRYRVAADYDLYLRLHEAGAREVLVPDVLSEFRLGGLSSSDAVRTARQYRDVRIAHGSSRVWEQLVMVKSAAAARLVGALRGAGAAERESGS